MHDTQIIDIRKSILTTLGMPEDAWTSQFDEPRLNSNPSWPGTDYTPSTPAELATFIDHTLLRADATDDEIIGLCQQATRHGFASVCVNSSHVPACTQHFLQTAKASPASHQPRVCAVAGFPLGAAATPVKASEVHYVIENGGNEVDMVLNIGKLKSGDIRYVFNDILAVTAAAGPANTVKVILETGYLTDEQIVTACTIAVLANVEFVKTSTGFGPGSATTEHVSLMRRVVGPSLGVKASGGIRDAGSALAMIRAGANRIGTSSGVAIITGAAGQFNY